MKILIAEDDLVSRKLLESILLKKGEEVITAVDGKNAYEILIGSDYPQMAILDWMMPKIDGVDVVKKLRQERPDSLIYIIMLTTKNEKEDVVEALKSGADDYLTKPYDMGELWARVDVGKRILSLQNDLKEKIKKLESAMGRIKTLEGFLPICSYCKKIKNEKGIWDQMEVYISNHSDALFTHSICNHCMKIHFPDFEED